MAYIVLDGDMQAPRFGNYPRFGNHPRFGNYPNEKRPTKLVNLF